MLQSPTRSVKPYVYNSSPILGLHVFAVLSLLRVYQAC